ncbi:site-specific integrase [Microbacterium foliorum]|uniref:Site-specific integrase n=1 Tax=Microbacterium foliorum TaxID=104336 RepID=A0A4Y5YQ56_9MICO|nr:tyrosine-type recombinase/integrase [Microbacterium foliorum]QDE34837.1 site-specific integrase [Microbacterium foliorum]
MPEEMKGRVPRQFRDASISLFRADERVFEGMVEGWRTQMLARGLTVETIKGKVSTIRRFQQHAGAFPWQWGPADVEQYFAEARGRAEKPLSVRTLRQYSGSIGMFCSFVTNPAYGWAEYCESTFGDVPSQIIFEWNSPRHTADDDVATSNRALTHDELQILFDYIDDLVDRERAAGSKRWRSLLRDSMAFKLCYAYGLRRRELAMLELADFGPNPYISDYGVFGALTVRWGKGTEGSGPRRRTVLTVPKFEWAVPLMKTWLAPGRRNEFPTSEGSPALWPSERQARVGLSTFGNSFSRLREEAGLPQNLGLHCLRHSYITHLLEAGYDPAFVQVQVGHKNASTTGLYTHVSSSFRQKEVQRMLTKRAAQLTSGTPRDGTDDRAAPHWI